jgi:epoxyqueuosine reductase QueG
VGVDPIALVAEAVHDTGLNLVGSCGIEAYDRRAPPGLRSPDLMARARGVIVVASTGRELWNAFHAAMEASEGEGSGWHAAHPLDAYVAGVLDRVDVAFAKAGVGSRRFEPTLSAPVPIDFRALGELAGLGTMGPFGLLIHETHGPWWALRGAWLVDVEVPAANVPRVPCAGCPAPCLGSSRRPEGILLATASVRGRCPVGVESRYSDEQIAYHYDREATLARFRGV